MTKSQINEQRDSASTANAQQEFTVSGALQQFLETGERFLLYKMHLADGRELEMGSTALA